MDTEKDNIINSMNTFIKARVPIPFYKEWTNFADENFHGNYYLFLKSTLESFKEKVNGLSVKETNEEVKLLRDRIIKIEEEMKK